MSNLKRKKIATAFSGGFDSVAVTAFSLMNVPYDEYHLIYFDYGNASAEYEIMKAKNMIKIFKEKFPDKEFIFVVKEINLGEHNLSDTVSDDDYIPLRNLIFISHLASYAEKNDIGLISTGIVNDVDAFPDSTRFFLHAMNTVLGIATEGKVSISVMSAYNSKVDYYDLLRDDFPEILDVAHCDFPTEDLKACGNCSACESRVIFLNSLKKLYER